MSPKIISAEELTQPVRRWDQLPKFTKEQTPLVENPANQDPEIHIQKKILHSEELTQPVRRWDNLPQFKPETPLSKENTPQEKSNFVPELAKFKAQIAAAKAAAAPPPPPKAEEIAAHAQKQYADSFERGQQDGRSKGFEQGYRDGLTQGQAEGVQQGIEQGRPEGVTIGKQEGFQHGHEEGYQEGLGVGLEDGRREGFNQGFAEGRTAGLAEGHAEGHAAGQAAGFSQGLEEGRQTGLEQGIAEGQRTGHAEGLDEGRRTGHVEGLEQGRREGFSKGEAELKAKLARLEKLLTVLDRPLKELDPIVEEQIVALAVLIARQVIGCELQQDRGIITSVVRAALENLPTARRNLRLFLHPDDISLVQEADTESNFNLTPDPKITRGGCRIETDNSRIDATVEQRLNQVITQLFGEAQSNPTG